jgi:hypothetical protein
LAGGRGASRAITTGPGVEGPTAEVYDWDGLNRLVTANAGSLTTLPSGLSRACLDVDWEMLEMRAEWNGTSRGLVPASAMSSPRGRAGLLLSLALGVLLVAGCSRHEYSVGIWNKTGAPIEDAVVAFGSVRFGMGHIVQNGLAAHGYVTMRPPSTALVEWRDASGAPVSINVEVSRWLKSGIPFRGDLIFFINLDRTVSFVPVREGTNWAETTGMSDAAGGQDFVPKAPV